MKIALVYITCYQVLQKKFVAGLNLINTCYKNHSVVLKTLLKM